METINNADIVIHLAGEPVAQRWSEAVKARIRSSRVLGTRNLVRGIMSAKYPPKVLVCASGIGCYGDRGDEILTEESRLGKGFLPEVCAEWEKEALTAEAAGLRVVCVRIGIVLGKGGGALEKMVPAFRMGGGGRLGSGRQWMSWIHLDDLIGMFLFAAAQASLRGPLNGCGPEPVRNSEFSDALGAALHRPSLLPVPGFALKMLMGEMADITLQSQRAIPKKALDAGFAFQYSDLRSALANLFS